MVVRARASRLSPPGDPRLHSRTARSRSQLYRRVCYYPILSLLFSFQSLQAPCLSAEPTESSTSLEQLKRPPFGGPGNAPPSAESLPHKPQFDCQVAFRHQLEKYNILVPGVNTLKTFCGDFSRCFQSLQAPRLSAEHCNLSCRVVLLTPPTRFRIGRLRCRREVL